MGERPQWSELRPGPDGLVATVVQHAIDGRVLMVGHVNEAALAATHACGQMTFWSRSRQSLWRKGESSGNTLAVQSLRWDCDADALLAQVIPAGPTCHTGASSCFFKHDDAEDDGPVATEGAALAALHRTIAARSRGEGVTSDSGQSYVRRLLEGGMEAISAKITEEAAELVAALESESEERVVSEAADLQFFATVGLFARGLRPADVDQELERRAGRSGLDEKAARKKGSSK